MEIKEVYQQVFQAFSVLSDAQELLGWAIGEWQPVNAQVNHAKRHLLSIIEADEQGYAEAMRDLPLTCTLPCDEPTRKAFKVAAVSSNRNSFGLRSMVVVAQDGEAYRVLSNDLHIKREREVLLVERHDGRWNFAALSYEVPEKLPTAPPDVVKELEQ